MNITVTIKSWKELRHVLEDRALWAFRGQPDARWPLETMLYRQAQQNGSLEYSHLRHREEWLLYQFRRFAHHHRQDLPSENEYIDWLALIQHYGGPTRFLDFSYSFYVAAFFAVEEARTDAAVWAISLPDIESANYETLAHSAGGAIHEIRKKHNEKFTEVYLSNKTTMGVIHVEPDRAHERMWIQQGLFLAPLNPDKPFMDNLAASFGVKEIPDPEPVYWNERINEQTHREFFEDDSISLIKVVIPRDIHTEILSELREMNINAATLFPGLEGAARSLKYHV